MTSQPPAAGSDPQDTPVEKLQEQSANQPNNVEEASGADYVVERQLAEMDAGYLYPPSASDPAAPGVQDLAVGGTMWLAQVGDVPLHIYAQPGATSQATTVAAGGQVSVIEGPQKQGGVSWLRVRTAEGDEGWVKSDDLQSS